MRKNKRSLVQMVKLIQEIKEDLMEYRLNLPDGVSSLKISIRASENLCDDLYSTLNFAAIDSKMDPPKKKESK